MKELIKVLKIRGGHHQLIMFMTGPAGAGKSTARKVTQKCCLKFCHAMGILWSNWTFFTAYTMAAAMAIGRFTICKSVFILTKRALTKEDKKMWTDVRMLVIDEISCMNDDQL